MNWRKQNRWLHKKLGYLFFGMAIIYGVSGIALNHHIVRHWNPSQIERYEKIEGVNPASREAVNKDFIIGILELAGEKKDYKSYFFLNDKSLLIYLKNGHINVDLENGSATLTKVTNRRFFREINFLHYNKPKNLWTYIADLFGLSMVLLAVTGILMAKGKKGVLGPGGLLVIAGIVIPIIFLIIYL